MACMPLGGGGVDERCLQSSLTQCLFAPSESCHLIAGCPSKLWDKLIQHMRDDHCVDWRRHRDSARAQREAGPALKKKRKRKKNLLSTGLTLGKGRRPPWLLTAQPVSRRDLPANCHLVVHPLFMFTTSWIQIGQAGGPAGEIATSSLAERTADGEGPTLPICP